MNIKELLSHKISLIPKSLIPTISLCMIVIALILIIVFFVICVAYINNQPQSAVKKDETDKKKNLPPIKIRNEDLPIISGRLGEILALHGILKTGQLTKIFFKVLEIIKESTYDIRWRYKFPCFMMVGPTKSGKSTILDSLTLEHISSDVYSIDSMWKLFQKGAIFELPRTDSVEETSKFWSFISELFVFIKPRRPLDGIIITLPADMLLSDVCDIEKTSREMFEQIFKFQGEINFHLPIYIIVTKMDLISGFSEFAYLLNDQSKQQIFGWSCPYSINCAFSTSWIDEIFQTVNTGIKKACIYFAKTDKISKNLEDAILFESNFNKIKNSLSQYLHSMFCYHNPENGLILRGVYFVGKQKQIEEISSDIVNPMALSPNTNSVFENSYNDNLCFANDLFKEKIFKESNIAYPIKIDAIDMNKAEYRNKIIFAAGSTILSLGWFWGNASIKEKIYEYYQLLVSVKSTMIKIRSLEENLKGDEDQTMINKHTTTLLKTMPPVKSLDLKSIFVPQSWFSNLKSDMLETLGLVFDSVIIRAMYIDINLNTKGILQNYFDNFKPCAEKKDLFNISSFTSFKNLQSFVKQICSIEKVSTEYNLIRHLEDRKSISDLTTTLFNEQFDISDEMKNHVPNKKLIPPKFDIDLFKPKIEHNLKTIFVAFLKDVFDVTIEKILQNLSEDIEKILEISKDSSLSYSTKDLAKTYNKTILIADIFKNKNFSWVSQKRFSPSTEYAELIDDLLTSNIVNKNFIEELLKLAEVEFFKFKSRLLEYKTDLTGKLLSYDIQTTSAGFVNFQKEVQSVLDQEFICVIPDNKLVTMILEDKMLIWDLKRLKEISNLIDKYYEFAATMPKSMRAQYFEIYKSLARKCFYSTLDPMLGNAQILDDIPLGHSRDLLEDAYKRQAINIRKASLAILKIAKIIDEIQEEDNLRDFGFSSVIVFHYFSLLEKIDELFNLETPYSAGSAVLDNWNGDKNPIDIDDKDSMKQYLTAQFERIRFLAKDLALPIVDLLSMPHFIEKVKDIKIINKWKEIITSINDYENKKPGNSIAALEQFLSNSLSKVSIGSFDDQGEIKTISEASGDYFLSKRSDVAKSLLSRADIVQYEKAANSYGKINKFFNDKLSHKFPFGKSEQDASVKDIEDYINLYEKNIKNVINTLERNKDIKKINVEAIEFLNLMDSKLIPFMKIWIAHSKASDANSASVLFKIQNRPSPNSEVLTSSILDRIISINDAPVANNSNGTFFNNDKVTASFNWVSSSEEKPYEKGASDNLLINGTKATFSYAGKWSIFRMIEENKINKELESPNGVSLQFNIPITDSKKENTILTSKIIVKITPMYKSGDKISPLVWPIFCESSPPLHNNESRSAENHPDSGAKISFDEITGKDEDHKNHLQHP